MKLYIIEDEKVEFIELIETKTAVRSKHFIFSVIKHEEVYYVHVGRDVTISSNILKTSEFLHMNNEKGNSCELLLIESNEEDETYQKYQVDDTVTIGKSFASDIQLVNENIPLHTLTIDPTNHLLKIHEKNSLISLNQHVIHEDTKYNWMDELIIASTHIIFMDEAIMMNCNDRITVHLPFYHPKQKIEKLILPKQKRRIYHRVPRFKQVFIYEYKDQTCTVVDSSERSFVLTMLPSIMMATASLCVGSVNAYVGYQAGREFIQILPMILIPSVMFISALLLQPITFFLEKRREKKKQLKCKQDNIDKWNQIKQNLHIFIEEYKEYCFKFYPDVPTIIQQIKNDKEIYIHDSKDGLLLRLGNKSNVIEIKNSEKNILNDSNKMIIDESLPWIVDLKKYSKVQIKDNKYNIDYLKYILLQLELHYEFPVILVCDKQFVDNAFWIRSLNNTFFKYKRYIFDDSVQLENQIHALQIQPLLIQYHVHLNTKVDALTITFVDDFNAEERDISIDLDDKNVYFHAIDTQEKFNFNSPKIDDMDFLLYLLRRNRSFEVENTLFSVNEIHHINQYFIEDRWNQNSTHKNLLCPIGRNEKNEVIHLNLSERGDGPHGLIAGTTGSGKTELLVSLVLSLSMNYSYEDVQFIYIDFKGGGGANLLKGLPHLNGILTNLDVNATKRALVSFQNECEYRQKCFLNMSIGINHSITNMNDYNAHLDKNLLLPKLPELIIIVDEFAELKKSYPEFLKELISISRIGRSLGIHLILCTQKPAGIVNDEIWSNSNFKLCLKVLEKRDSKEVIQTEEAYELQNPGEFILISNQQHIHGFSAYANANADTYSSKIYSIRLNGTATLVSSHTNITQAALLVDRIKEIKSLPIRRLWLDEPDQLSWNHLAKKDCVGIVDDYYHCTQYGFRFFSKEDYNHLIVSFDTNEKHNFMNILIANLIQYHDNDLQLFMIDDLFLDLKTVYDSYFCFSEYIKSDDEDKINAIFRYLMRKSSSEKILMITDTLRFFEENEANHLLLRKLLERSHEIHVQVILFSNQSSIFTYRDMAYIHDRILLKTNSLQIIQDLFETSEKVTQVKSKWGLLKKDKLLRFRYYVLSLNELIEIAQSYKSKHSLDIRFHIPSMTKIINRNHYSANMIPLGKSYITYDWVSLPITSCLYVVSLYPYEFQDYRKTMLMYAKCTDRLSDNEDDGQLIFLSLDEYKYKHNDSYPVLYIGTSYSHQFTFHSKIKDLKENQGLLFYKHESELIKVL